MKKTLILVAATLLLSRISLAQDCSNTAFPYDYCDGSGNIHVFCATHPCQGPDPVVPPGNWNVLRSCPMPNCINLDDNFGTTFTHISLPHVQLDPDGNEVSVFTESGANDDASNALISWLGFCHDKAGDGRGCCITVSLGLVGSDLGNVDLFNALANTPLEQLGPDCKVPCSSMHIIVNYTDEFRLHLDNPTDNDWPDDMNPTVGYYDFFTGLSAPNLGSGYHAYSFYQLMEHEIGHCLGLEEANAQAENGNCSHTDMVMSRHNNGDDLPPRSISSSSDDKCYFEKLYCSSYCSKSCSEAVIAPKSKTAGFPRLTAWPNPTNGMVKIRFDIPNAAEAQVAVRDVLGNVVRTVADNWQASGLYEQSIDISNLPAGPYYIEFKTADYTRTTRITVVH